MLLRSMFQFGSMYAVVPVRCTFWFGSMYTYLQFDVCLGLGRCMLSFPLDISCCSDSIHAAVPIRSMRLLRYDLHLGGIGLMYAVVSVQTMLLFRSIYVLVCFDYARSGSMYVWFDVAIRVDVGCGPMCVPVRFDTCSGSPRYLFRLALNMFRFDGCFGSLYLCQFWFDVYPAQFDMCSGSVRFMFPFPSIMLVPARCIFRLGLIHDPFLFMFRVASIMLVLVRCTLSLCLLV